MVSAERVSLYSVLINLALVGLKGLVGLLSGSLAVLADAVHSLSDVVAAGAVWLGIKLSQRKSPQFPYGLYKVENLVALGVAGALFFAAYEIGREALVAPLTASLQHVPLAMAAMLLEILIAFAFSRYERRAAEETGSPSLQADSEHLRTHVWSAGVILLSLAGSWLGWPLDRPAAVVIVGFILHAGWQVLRESVRVLLDASLDFATLDRAKQTLLAEPRVRQLKSLTGRNSGRFKFLEAEVVLKVGDLERAHQVATRLEEQLKRTISHLDRVMIHVEPLVKPAIRYAIPLEGTGGISQHFGEAPRFALLDVRPADRHLLRWKEWTNPFQGLERGKGIRVAEFLVASDVDVVVLREELQGRGPEYVFSDAGIEVIRTEQEEWAALLEELNILAGEEEPSSPASEGGEDHDPRETVSLCGLRP